MPSKHISNLITVTLLLLFISLKGLRPYKALSSEYILWLCTTVCLSFHLLSLLSPQLKFSPSHNLYAVFYHKSSNINFRSKMYQESLLYTKSYTRSVLLSHAPE